MDILVATNRSGLIKEKRITKILVPVDYSTAAINAFSFACDIAQKLDAVIHVLHVYQVPYIDNYVGSVTNELMESVKQKEENDYSAFAEKYIAPLKQRIDFEHTIKMGLVADTIRDLSEEVNADLIIMGIQGEKKAGGKLFGSVAWHTVKRSAVPVLAIPEEIHPGSISNILFVEEGNTNDIKMIRYLLSVAAVLQAEIYIVHFLEFGKGEGNLLDSIADEFRPEINNNLIHLHLSVHQNNAEVIKKFAFENDIGMIAMQSHKKGLFRSLFHKEISREIILHTNMPILVFNEDT